MFFTVSVRDISEKKENEREKADLLLKYRELTTDLERQKMALDEHAIVGIEDALLLLPAMEAGQDTVSSTRSTPYQETQELISHA